MARTSSSLTRSLPLLPRLRSPGFAPATLLAVLQACVPSVAFSVLFGYPVWDPVPLLLIALAVLAAPLQVLVRLAYLLASAVGLLHAWNITVYTLPFYFRFVTLDSLPWSAGQLVAAALCIVAFACPLPRALGRSPAAVALAVAGVVLILAKAIPLAHEVPAFGPRVKAHVRSPALRAGYDFLDAGRAIARDYAANDAAAAQPPAQPGPTFAAAVSALPVPPEKLLLVIVEAWSESEASFADVRRVLAAHGHATSASGYTEYRGSTLPGELRELCGTFVSLGRFRPGGVETQGCLPERMRAAGHRTLGVHGYTRAFYLRDAIWRDLGFTARVFADALPDARRCGGPFAGVCDSDAIEYALDELARPGPAFVYVLTLSSHEPVREPDADRSCAWFAGVPEAVVTQRVARQSLCHLARGLAARPELSGAYVYVVGDHAPPSIAHTGLVPPGVVPYLVLAPASR